LTPKTGACEPGAVRSRFDWGKAGQIYKRKAALRPEAQWLWALNGVPTAPDAPASTGLAASLDEAMAALQERWSKWSASSELTEKVSGS
jgi:hypothetical protein